MAFNVPDYTTDDFSFGPARLFIGVVGATPTSDVGGVNSGGTFTMTREKLTVEQGSPKIIVKEYSVRETAEINFESIEWDLNTLYQALGGGTYTPDNPVTDMSTLEFGGEMDITNVALRVVHVTPAGNTVTIDVFTASPAGNAEFNFGDDLHAFPLAFTAIRSTTDWASVALASGKELFKITYDKT